MISFKNKKNLLIFSLFFFLFFAGTADAATLFMEPSQTEVTVGNIVTVQIAIDTSGTVINNAESIIQFPKDLLEIISIDKTSVFSLWVEEPTFSNNTGQISFNGGVPNPGYQGSGGKIISVVFRTKKAGTASVVFSNSAVRANDGLGTDVLTSKNGAEIRIIQEPAEIVPPTDLLMSIHSSSHPNQNNWYNESDVKLSWSLPKGTEAVRTLLGAYPDSQPTVYYDSPITSKNIEDVGDGVWYFHVDYLNAGIWSEAEHFRIKIDTTNPTDLIAEAEKDETGGIVINVKASDSLSGIDYFEIIPDSEDSIDVNADKNGEASVEIPFSTSGDHSIVIIAYDDAGNSIQTITNVVSSIVSELTIDSYPALIKVNENIEAGGAAPYPNAPIRLSLQNSDGIVETYKVKSNSYSRFNFISQPITEEGEYILWAEIVNDDGEIRYSSDKLTIVVDEPLLLQIGSYTIGLMRVLIPALILLILFLLILLYGWIKLFALYRRVRKEGAEAEMTVDEAFYTLKRDLDQHIQKLKSVKSKRKLTVEETDFLETFEEELSEAKKAISKEVKDISKK